ncbi:hypothetical protein BH23VER1_BH23VER1_10340 [soil metagenome]
MISRRILVVDDERIVAEDIIECLTQMGCEVVGTAQSGAEALEIASVTRPDLILMDIVLQGEMDGVEAASVIREQLGIPCIFLTAYSDPGVLDRAKMIGPLGYIVKPFDEEGLRSSVEVALHRISMDGAVKESSEWFATTLMSIGDGVIATDARGMITFMNPGATTVLGCREQDAVGRYVEEVAPMIDEGNGCRVTNTALSALQTGERVHLPRLAGIYRRSADILPVDHSASPIRDSQGQLVGAILIFRDATERRRAEDASRRENERLEVLVEERTTEILSANKRLVAEIEERKRVEQELNYRVGMQALLGGVMHRFLRARPVELDSALEAALREFGTFLDVDAAYLLRYTCEGSEVRVAAEWRAMGAPTIDLEGGDASPELQILATWRHRFKGADSVLIARESEGGHASLPQVLPEIARARKARSVLLLPLLDEDEVTGFLGVDCGGADREWNREEATLLRMAGDVIQTALRRKRATKDNEDLLLQLHQSQKMEAIGKLSGGIAHDFNNMLLPIIGYSDMLLEKIPPGGEMVEELTEIRRSAERAAALTRQMLAFSRKQVIRKTVVDLNEQLEGLEKMLARIIGEDIALRTELEPDLPPVNADQGQIEQVLLNLVVNARDAMPGGGAITISTSLVDHPPADVRLLAPGAPSDRGQSYVCVTVGDEGAGIEPDIADKIFEPFFSTKGNEGTGLGLSVVYGIVEQHGGGIQVRSKPGAGSQLSIYLPAAHPATALPTAAATERLKPKGGSVRGRGEKILLVEDEISVIQFVSQALAQNGYEIVKATCFQDALLAFDAHGGDFDMIFTDAVLPDGNGVDLLERFLTQRPAAKALLSSGYTDKDSLLELAKEKDITFLQKPYALPILFQTVRDVIDQRTRAVLN